jgi:hypothetical protein
VNIYEGNRGTGNGGAMVTVGRLDADGRVVDRHLLPPRLDLRNHSPTGFEWGYGGSGPAQLALALCAHALGDDRRALEVYQHYKWQHVAGFKGPGWRLTDEQIRADVAALVGL